jgi:hypothetical protein
VEEEEGMPGARRSRTAAAPGPAAAADLVTNFSASTAQQLVSPTFKASAALADAGYSVLDVKGGFIAWEAAGLPVVK